LGTVSWSRSNQNRAELREDDALAGDAVAHDDVEGAQAVGRDEEQVAGVDLVDVADLPRATSLRFGQSVESRAVGCMGQRP
jgi:hypothetical protein